MAIPASAGAHRRTPRMPSTTTITATQRAAPRVWVMVSAIPANRPAPKSAAGRGRAPSSASSRLAPEAMDAAVVRAWWFASIDTRTAQGSASRAASARLPEASRAAR